MKMIKRAALFILAGYTSLLIFWMLFGFGRYTYSEFRYNLIPFATIKHFLDFNQVSAKMQAINLIGNIGVFVPFGILLPVMFQGRLIKSYITFFIGIFVLEMTQLLSRRGTFDIDDLLLNSVGFIIGYGIYRLGVLWVNSKKSGIL